MLPDRLTGIDETSRSSYYFLQEEDVLYYFGDFHIGRGWSGGPTNQLIKNYKRTPQEIAANPRAFQYYKDLAIGEIAAGLRKQFTLENIRRITFVPIPTSKTVGHPDHCDRLIRTLRQAFAGIDGMDVRPLLRITRDTEADHLSGGDRIDYDELLAITEVDPAQLRPEVRPNIVIFDDVLTSGKHYKVAKMRIRDVLPDRRLVGVFVARCIHPDPFAAFKNPDDVAF